MTDAWCPNCQQRVAPVRDPGWAPAVVGWVLLAALFRWSYGLHGPFDLVSSLPVALVVLGVPALAWLLLRRFLARTRCPICRTERLVHDLERPGQPRPPAGVVDLLHDDVLEVGAQHRPVDRDVDR